MVEIAPFLMVVLIVAIVSWSRLQRAKYDNNRAAPGDRAETERLTSDIRALKDRIAVLERIVTDGDHTHGLALEREIEALRDAREEGR